MGVVGGLVVGVGKERTRGGSHNRQQQGQRQQQELGERVIV